MSKWIKRYVKFWETIIPIFTDKTIKDEKQPFMTETRLRINLGKKLSTIFNRL